MRFFYTFIEIGFLPMSVFGRMSLYLCRHNKAKDYEEEQEKAEQAEG